MCHRQRRRSSGESRAVRHGAKMWGDVITVVQIDSSGELGVSLSGYTVALVVRHVTTGWLDGCPAGSNWAEEVRCLLSNISWRQPRKSGTSLAILPPSISKLAEN